MRLENTRKDDLLDKINVQTISFYKQLHAKVGVCIDDRLSVNLTRCQQIIKDVQAILDQEVAKL
jgi:hypothetical protein